MQAPLVWAGPRSLAATKGIAVAFSSSGYLDVSVPRVGTPCGVTGLATGWVAPFGNPGITACLQLPQAYRSLPRPSSPPCAKASTVRPYALDLMCLGVDSSTLQHTTRQFSKSNKQILNVECPISKFGIGYSPFAVLLIERGSAGDFRDLSADPKAGLLESPERR